MTPADHLIAAAAWILFGAVHSLLAAERVKRALAARLGGAVRLAYNLFAVAHLALTWWLAEGWAGAAAGAFDRPPALAVGQGVAFTLGLGLMLVGLRGYDLGRFSGLAQWRAARRGTALTDDEPLRVDGLHRYVRHPLYTAGFLLLWGRVADPASLSTALWTSLYLVVGTLFEERKLLRLYGSAYARYRARVPMYLPWRGRALGSDAP